MNQLTQVWQQAHGNTIKVKSQALNPALWLAGIGSASGSFLLAFGSTTLSQTLGAIAMVGCLLLAVVAYAWFAVKDPDRLGSEAFIIQKAVLLYSQQKGGPLQLGEQEPAVKAPELLAPPGDVNAN